MPSTPTPPRGELVPDYRRARRLLQRREAMMLAEGERLYRQYGAQRAMGFVDGYRLAMDYLAGV